MKKFTLTLISFFSLSFAFGQWTTVATDSDAISPTTQITGVTISSIADTSAEAVDVFKIEIRDSGNGDTEDTIVTSLKIKPHTTNNTDWTDVIQGLVFDDGVNYITPASINITDAFIEVTFNSGDLVIPENDSTIITIAVYLNTSNINDGEILSFMVDADDHGFTADNSGSTFVNIFDADFNSNDFTIDVEATELIITQQPTNVEVQSVMSPNVTVAYTDENGNIDIDYDSLGATATLSATGAALISTTDGTPVNGVMTFDDIEFNTTNTGVTLTITDGGNITNTTITSTTFDVTGEQEIEIEANGFTIVNGNNMPDEDHNTEFGTINIVGGTYTQTYNISNLGVLDLILTDPSPYISIGGVNPGDFSVTLLPTTPIPGVSDSAFEITFNPSAAGLREAVINIASNDADESNYSFAIQGTGIDYTPCNKQTGVTIKSENFEGAGDWNYTLTPVTYDTGSDVWSNSTSVGNGGDSITSGANGTSNFWGMRDLNNDNGGNANYHKLSFEAIDISNIKNVKLSFDYYSHGYEASDEIRYRVMYDNGTTWSTGIALNKNTDAWQTVTINIPDSENFVRLQLKAKQDGGNDWAGFDNVKLVGDVVQSTTWYDNAGTLEWSNGVPTSTTKAIFTDTYNETEPSIETCACEIKSGVTVTIGADKHLLVETDIENNGIIEIKHEGSLVQHKKDAVLSGSGEYKIHKTTTEYVEYDYTYWSSPIEDADINSVFNTNSTLSTGSSTNSDTFSNASKIYSFTTANFGDADNDTFNDSSNNPDWIVTSGLMEEGQGYIAMGAGADFPFDSANIATGLKQSVIFIGNKVNNGDISVPVVLDANNTDNFTNQNLIGNPYPSAIDGEKFILANSNVGTLYFWTHKTPISSSTSGPDAYNFTNDDYATFTTAGYAASASGATVPGDKLIASCQGFFADITTDGTVEFNNSMRVNSDNDNFFRPTTENQRDRIWLNMTNNDGLFRQILIGFFNDATVNYDRIYDGRRAFNGTNYDFYSLLNNEKFAIQALPLITSDVTIPLGIAAPQTGTFTISIDNFEGDIENTNVYIKDNLFNIIHDLRISDFQFDITQTGDTNNRFELLFSRNTLSVTNNKITSELIVAQKGDFLNLRSSDNSNIESAIMYNMLGQKVGFNTSKNNNLQLPVSNISSGSVLIIKATLDNGSVITKKLIKL